MKGRREERGGRAEEDGAFVSGFLGFGFASPVLLLLDGRFCPSLSLQLDYHLGARCSQKKVWREGDT